MANFSSETFIKRIQATSTVLFTFALNNLRFETYSNQTAGKQQLKSTKPSRIKNYLPRKFR